MLYGLAADRISGGSQPYGEVQEWLNWQHWKCCVRGTVPWVRIPPSPPDKIRKKSAKAVEICSQRPSRFFVVVEIQAEIAWPVCSVCLDVSQLSAAAAASGREK